MSMEQTCRDLPEDCWECIANRVGGNHHGHLEQLSLVSKMFLSITNRLRLTLRIVNPSIELLSKQLLRFQYLKKIDLSNFQGVLQGALTAILESKLTLEELDVSHKQNPCITLLNQMGLKMTSFKILRCCHSNLSDKELIALADSFDSLQELDISNQYRQDVTDEGIIALSKKLKFLQKINLTGNRKITNRSLISISTNCVHLTEVILRNCGGITQEGISYMLDNSPNYNSLIIASYVNRPLVLKTLFKPSHHLFKIEFCYVKIPNELLFEMISANLPLKSFRLSFCTSFTLDGLSSVLKAYNSLEFLGLDGTEFLTDESITHLCHFTRSITSINLDSCFKLTSASFIAIAFACSSLNHIEMSISSSSKLLSEEHNGLIIMNPEIKSASLTCKNVKGLLQICPNLRVLKLTDLAPSYDLNIGYILARCLQLKRLTINHNGKIKFDEEHDQQVSYKLESLSMKKSCVESRVLEMIGKRCHDLLSIDLEGCMSVTEKGVRALVKSCGKLRYMNLDWCTKVSKDDVVWMMDKCSSLKEIVIPFPLYSIDDDNFVTNCLLTEGHSIAYEGHHWEDCCFDFAFGM